MLSRSTNKAQITQINFVDAMNALPPKLAPSDTATDFDYRSDNEVDYKHKNYPKQKLSVEEQSYPTRSKPNDFIDNEVLSGSQLYSCRNTLEFSPIMIDSFPIKPGKEIYVQIFGPGLDNDSRNNAIMIGECYNVRMSAQLYTQKYLGIIYSCLKYQYIFYYVEFVIRIYLSLASLIK